MTALDSTAIDSAPTVASLEAIRYRDGRLWILDQLQLPHRTEYREITSTQDAFTAIRSMQVRGAPAIAIVGMLGVAADISRKQCASFDGKQSRNADVVYQELESMLECVQTARPTAVNVFKAAAEVRALLKARRSASNATGQDLVRVMVEYAERLLMEDVKANRAIGDFGAQWILANCLDAAKHDGKVKVLTHCNTGSLATGGYGTALGIVRSLQAQNALAQVFCTETRPYNQGSRLTAYELVVDKLARPTLICDSMASVLLQLQKQQGYPLAAIVVGADRVAANGDTANKVGTYQLAITARYHGVKFVVAAPSTSIDPNTQSGQEIVIEERPAQELTQVTGRKVNGDELISVSMAPSDISVWNPSFDVTPAELIDAIVTEQGVFERDAVTGCFNFSSLKGYTKEQQ